MADLSTFAQTVSNTGATVAVLPSNNYKTAPLSNYSTRVLEFFTIDIADIETNYENSNSVFSKVVRGVQTIAQIAAVGTPTADGVVVVVEGDTNPDSGPAFSTDATPTKAERMKAAVDAATGGASAVAQVVLQGNALV